MKKLTDRQFITGVLKTVFILFVSVVLIIWAWNSAMTTIFGLPVIHFREALGIIILVAGISLLVRPGHIQGGFFSGNRP